MKTLPEKLKEILDSFFTVGGEKRVSDLEKQLLAAFGEYVESRKLEKKSVEELLIVMGSAYNDLSVKVAFKEGYNAAISEMMQSLLSGLSEGKK